MKVAEARDGTKIEPNHVYTIPSDRFLRVEDGVLRLSEPFREEGRQLPIDFLFRSLAQVQRERGVGIVLSGTGSDGTLGIREIRAVGGLTMAQDPQTADYASMPQSAIGTRRRRLRARSHADGRAPDRLRAPRLPGGPPGRPGAGERRGGEHPQRRLRPHAPGLPPLQAQHHPAPHRAPHGPAPDRRRAGLPGAGAQGREGGRRAEPRDAHRRDQLLPRAGRVRRPPGACPDGNRAGQAGAVHGARLGARLCHGGGGILPGHPAARDAGRRAQDLRPAGVRHRRRRAGPGRRPTGHLPGEHHGRRQRRASGALLRQDGRRLQGRRSVAREPGLRPARPAERAALQQHGPDQLPQRADLPGERRPRRRCWTCSPSR